MVFRSFRLNCLIRLILISLSIFLLIFTYGRASLYATTFIVFLVVVYQIWALFRYIERTNRNLTRFLWSIKYSDFSQSFESNVKGLAFKELNFAFSTVIREFQKARAEKEEHFRYLQTIIQHVNVGLLAFGENGNIELFNKAAKKLIGVTRPRNIAHLKVGDVNLASRLQDLRAGGRRFLKIQDGNESTQLLLHATEFKLHQKAFKLVSLQNIQSELEEKEMEAWQNLIRVLTHEIMNSVAPISSLASTASDIMDSRGECELAAEDVEDICRAVHTIERRSKGLLSFVENYRKLTRIPKPRLESFSVDGIVSRTRDLLTDEMETGQVNFQASITPNDLTMTADPALIEQVLINLCKNALQAVRDTDNPRVQVVAQIGERGRLEIKVIDNGPGIRAEVLENIFIPFFTTKKDGSGIGLSLSRQIMRLHRGSLTATSRPDDETTFTIRL